MGAFYPKARFLERAMHKGWGGRNPLTGLNLLQLGTNPMGYAMGAWSQSPYGAKPFAT